MNFRHRFTVNAPLWAVAEFHSDSSALRYLTPPPLIVRFNEVQPIEEGAVVDFTIWAGPLPIRWTAVHTHVTEKNGFVDTQTRGPFQSWRHKHQFKALNENTTEIIDEIEAEYGGLISRFMWLGMPLLFGYRAWRTKLALDGKANNSLLKPVEYS
jgi:ligand-binding SRPBCC domain-containing protein